ncbi:hypothetical protein POM88_000102 [Heracleum sosnowskyi]|uniref:J domain-containing protein n=1 Tax=Heracleum sosnowskyi TaxID=360622 RepID=A0AAD8JDM0_9APIA|nr:hypothetical protein POM88_000102 [Heracleum sosnowskyi]
MTVLGKDASAALAVVESHQQRLTSQRLLALIEEELTYHEWVAAIIREIETEIVYEKQREDSAPPVIADNLFSGKTMYFLAEKDIATEHFQRICEAYELLSDVNKRHIYDIYGTEGLPSGLEHGPELDQVEEIKQELENLRRQVQDMLLIPTQSQVSKRNFIVVGGNLAVTGESGGAGTTAVLRNQISSALAIEFMASAGLQSLVGLQTSRQLSGNTGATIGLSMLVRQVGQRENAEVELAGFDQHMWINEKGLLQVMVLLNYSKSKASEAEEKLGFTKNQLTFLKSNSW